MTEIDPAPGGDGPLIERARAGDMRAFEALYRKHVGRVHGLCLRMLRHPDLAEDCTQQAFINAWRALPTFESRSAFGTWLHRIAVNVVLSHQESASMLGIAEGTCKAQLHRARQMLRQRLGLEEAQVG